MRSARLKTNGNSKGKMATYHLTVKGGAKGKAAPHAEYISRDGKYSFGDRYEDLEATAYGNMPKWAAHNPAHFWQASDQNERANGMAYREIEVALPRELNPEQRRELVEEFVSQKLGDSHAFQWAIHTPRAALEKGEQPHAHIMYSERRQDGIERDPSQYFKRYNAKNPERGGCQKGDSTGATQAERLAKRKAELLDLRECWATLQNKHLKQYGYAVTVDHRSLKDQGSTRTAEKHLGGSGVRLLDASSASALLEYRAAEGARERSQRELSSIIDLSGDLAAAKASRQQAELRTEYIGIPSVVSQQIAPEKIGLFSKLKGAIVGKIDEAKDKKAQAAADALAATARAEAERQLKAEALKETILSKAREEAKQFDLRVQMAKKDQANYKPPVQPEPKKVVVRNEQPNLLQTAKTQVKVEAQKSVAPEQVVSADVLISREALRNKYEKMPIQELHAVYKDFRKDNVPHEQIAAMHPEMVKRLESEVERQERERQKQAEQQEVKKSVTPQPKPKQQDQDREL